MRKMSLDYKPPSCNFTKRHVLIADKCLNYINGREGMLGSSGMTGFTTHRTINAVRTDPFSVRYDARSIMIHSKPASRPTLFL